MIGIADDVDTAHATVLLSRYGGDLFYEVLMQLSVSNVHLTCGTVIAAMRDSTNPKIRSLAKSRSDRNMRKEVSRVLHRFKTGGRHAIVGGRFKPSAISTSPLAALDAQKWIAFSKSVSFPLVNDPLVPASNVYSCSLIPKGKAPPAKLKIFARFLSHCRRLVGEHERRRRRSNFHFCPKTPSAIFISKYEPTSAEQALGPHIDQCKCATQLFCLQCDPVDENKFEVLIEGKWQAPKFGEGVIITMSKEVYHRVLPVVKSRAVVVIFW